MTYAVKLKGINLKEKEKIMKYKLKDIKQHIVEECVSTEELLWLGNHKDEVLASGDLILCEWAGVSEEEARQLC